MEYLTADSDGALLRAEARVPHRAEEEAREKEAIAAKGRSEAASERADDARAEAAAAGDDASSGATALRVAGRGTMGVTFGAAAEAAVGSEGPPRRGLPLPGIPQELGSGRWDGIRSLPGGGGVHGPGGG